jgi:hypothetical protein
MKKQRSETQSEKRHRHQLHPNNDTQLTEMRPYGPRLQRQTDRDHDHRHHELTKRT